MSVSRPSVRPLRCACLHSPKALVKARLMPLFLGTAAGRVMDLRVSFDERQTALPLRPDTER